MMSSIVGGVLWELCKVGFTRRSYDIDECRVGKEEGYYLLDYESDIGMSGILNNGNGTRSIIVVVVVVVMMLPTNILNE